VYDGVPAIGEHTESALTGLLGLAPDEIARLGSTDVVGPAPVRAA
jgi:crotonobetainyl-CoA:carnitine CoA-transferase CaiB-like acyl-CoA transferase